MSPITSAVQCPFKEAALPFGGLAVKQVSLGEMRLAAQEGQGVLARPRTLHLSSVWALRRETLYSPGSKRPWREVRSSLEESGGTARVSPAFTLM